MLSFSFCSRRALTSFSCMSMPTVNKLLIKITPIDLYIPCIRTSMSQKILGCRGVHLWNDLIDEAKGARTYFKRFYLQKNKAMKLLEGHFHSSLDLTGESSCFLIIIHF